MFMDAVLAHDIVSPIQKDRRALATHDFHTLVGAEGWARLTPAIRERFAAKSVPTTIHYHGTMNVVRCNKAGWLLAHLCRLIGTPLAPFEGRDVPMHIEVYEDKAKGGVVWKRHYTFPNRKPVTVQSTKVFGHDRTLLECVGGGFGMFLTVYEQDHALHFLSTDYFWRVGPWTITLPTWLSPGTAHVVHTDEGHGWFRFTLCMTHSMLGETYFQDGLFREKEG